MSPPDSSQVDKALKVLCNAPESLLLSHKAELLAICDRLQSIRVVNSTAVTPATCTNTEPPITNHADRNSSPATIHRSTCSNTHSPTTALLNHEDLSPITSHGQPPQSVQDLVEGLNKDLTGIEKTIEETLSRVCHGQPAWMTDDPRVVDLVLPEGDHSPTAKFRRALSQRSLAVEFDAWEQKNYGVSKVNEGVKDTCKQTYGHISKFFEFNRERFGTERKEVVRKGVEHGVKLLMCDRLLGGTGFSAILMFQSRRLRHVKFEDLKSLRDIISGSDIQKLAEQKGEWLNHCQDDYEEWYEESIKLRGAQSGTKRRRLDSSSQNQPLAPYKPADVHWPLGGGNDEYGSYWPSRDGNDEYGSYWPSRDGNDEYGSYWPSRDGNDEYGSYSPAGVASNDLAWAPGVVAGSGSTASHESCFANLDRLPVSGTAFAL